MSFYVNENYVLASKFLTAPTRDEIDVECHKFNYIRVKLTEMIRPPTPIALANDLVQKVPIGSLIVSVDSRNEVMTILLAVESYEPVEVDSVFSNYGTVSCLCPVPVEELEAVKAQFNNIMVNHMDTIEPATAEKKVSPRLVKHACIDSSAQHEFTTTPNKNAKEPTELVTGSIRATQNYNSMVITGGGRSYLALSGEKWIENCVETDNRKIFVGGLPDISPPELAECFSQFDNVIDAMIMYDRKKRRQRGFGFITFATQEGLYRCIKQGRIQIHGKNVEIKKAQPLILQNKSGESTGGNELSDQLQSELEHKRCDPSLKMVDPYNASSASLACPYDNLLNLAINKEITFDDAPWQ